MSNPPSKGSLGSSSRLLLIEDLESDAALIRNYLQAIAPAEFEVETVTTLADGVARVQSRSYDAVVLDLSLPDSDGLKSLRVLNRLRRNLPIVILTGTDCGHQALEAVRCGAQDYLTKDHLTPDALVRSIRYSIERNRVRYQLSAYGLRLRSQNEKMRVDLELAKKIQRILQFRNGFGLEGELGALGISPDRWEVRYRYLPCSALAGDFHRVFPLSEDRMGVLVCDVAAHGIRSALMAALIRGLLNEEGERLERPGELLTHMNSVLTKTLNEEGIESSATACYLVADAKQGRVTCASAGHPSPYQIDHRSKLVGSLQPRATSLPLGMVGNETYPELSYPFDSANALILSTDGLRESEPADQGSFHDQIFSGLQSRMTQPLDRVLDGLISDARRLSGKEDFDDDVCLVGLRYAE